MKPKIIVFIFSLYAITSFAQNSVMLLPFVGKDKSEVVLSFNTKTGKSVEWYYDETLKKMTKARGGFQMPAATGIAANVMMKAYIGADGSEVVLVWNSATGESASWYYDEASKQMKKGVAGFQLPANIGLAGKVMMFPYLGADKSEVILCWETATGKSVSYYYDNAGKKFLKSTPNYQLPASPGVGGNVMMHPYIGKDGSEVVLVWSPTTGHSVSWYFDNTNRKYQKATAPFQLPENPGVSGNVMMYPYIGNDGSEVVLTWSGSTGTSVSWYYDNAAANFQKAIPKYQLPQATGVAQNVMMVPFVEKHHDEVIYVWNSATGQSVNYYYNNAEKRYEKSKPEFQLPANPLQ